MLLVELDLVELLPNLSGKLGDGPELLLQLVHGSDLSAPRTNPEEGALLVALVVVLDALPILVDLVDLPEESGERVIPADHPLDAVADGKDALRHVSGASLSQVVDLPVDSIEQSAKITVAPVLVILGPNLLELFAFVSVDHHLDLGDRLAELMRDPLLLELKVGETVIHL
jgi:hypothetical protein